MKNIITQDFHAQEAQRVAQLIADGGHYLFVGDHLANSVDSVASNVTESSSLVTDIFNNMIFGKEVSANDVAVMIPKQVWTSGTVYDSYSSSTNNLCHVVSESGSVYNVYKILDNANGSESTIRPSGTDANPFVTDDGYIWKYMFGIPLTTYTKFSTSKYVPYVANSAVIASSVPSSLDVIRVADGGVGYDNYFISEFRTADLPATTGSSTVYGLTETASNINDFYNGCYIKITDPSSAIVGEFRKITDYVVSGSTKRITIESAFSSSAAAADGYEIYPGVTISSSGPDYSPCYAWAIVDSAQSNTISSVEVFDAGSNHRSATAVVNAHASVGVTTTASLTPVISPVAGHGGSPLQELNGRFVGVVGTFSYQDTDVPQSNDVRTVGLLSNPKFKSGSIPLDSSIGSSFTVGEDLVFFQTIGSVGTTITYTGQSITGTSQSFLSKLKTNDYVLIASDSSHGIITQISSVSSNSDASTYNNYVGSVTGTMYLIRVISNGTLSAKAASLLTAASISQKLNQYCEVMGMTSGRFTGIGTPTFNDGKSDFTRFTQAARISGTVGTGTLAVDEKIVQGSASAYVHSIVDNHDGSFTLYLTNQSGVITTGTITGQTSGATFSVSTKYEGDLVDDVGQLVYVENLIPYTRAAYMKENIKIVLEL